MSDPPEPDQYDARWIAWNAAHYTREEPIKSRIIALYQERLDEPDLSFVGSIVTIYVSAGGPFKNYDHARKSHHLSVDERHTRALEAVRAFILEAIGDAR